MESVREVGSQVGGNKHKGGKCREKRRKKTENTKGGEVSASLLSTFSILAAAQIYRLFILHQGSAPNEKQTNKKESHSS